MKQARVREMADALRRMDSATREKIIVNVARHDPEVAAAIERAYFVFADVWTLGPEDFQRLFREVLGSLPRARLALALKTAGEEMMARVLACMPSRAGQELREEISALGPRRLSEVEAAQAEIAAIGTRLDGDGKFSRAA